MPDSPRGGDAWLLRLLAAKGLLDEKAPEPSRVSREFLMQNKISHEQLADALKEKYGIGFAEPETASLDKLAIALMPESFCGAHKAVPLKLNAESIEVLMSNPIDAAALDSIMNLTGRPPVAVFGLPEKIEELLSAGYGSEAVLFDLLKKLPDEAPVECVSYGDGDESSQVPGGAVAAPVTRLANLLIAQAVRLKASDIHVEQEDKETIVRYRIDGALRSMMKIPKYVGEGPLVSRIKIMANLDVADRRRPQDGRAKLMVGGEEIGLRVSTMPTSFGEKAVLRILDKRQAEVPLEALGFRPELLSRLTRLSRLEQGMLLLTGPTGSGKTTTLYSLLNALKSDDINIVTVEDPIEYRLEGINQIQVNEKAGMSFAAVLRSVLRQDPDVILVGEIRDRETADIAFQAALTGHMVFSTLHTNDAVAAVERLLDMGVERFKLAPALIGVVSQRLARRVCGGCRVETAPSPAAADALKKAGLPARQFKGAGCDRCAFTGVTGRVAVTEVLDLSDRAARDILSAPSEEFNLREEALRRGWLKTISEDALWHLAEGTVPLEEAAAYLDAAPRAPGVSAPAQAAKTPRRVLIVDDNVDNRNVIRDTLKTEGYDLAEAAGGAAAIEEIARRKPDLVLLDLMMPEVDGFAVVKRLRGEMGLADLPILILTAMSEAESQVQVLEIGADDYMTKPFNPKVLRVRVNALFRRSEYDRTET